MNSVRKRTKSLEQADSADEKGGKSLATRTGPTVHVVKASSLVWFSMGLLLGQLGCGPWLEEMASLLRGYSWDFRERCILQYKDSGYGLDFCRAPVDCNICRDVHQVDELYVDSLSVEEFEERYTLTSRPLVVRNASAHWRAMSVLDYDWLKQEYLRSPDILEFDDNDCWFNRYQSPDLRSLASVFRLSAARVSGGGGESSPWYVGWSVCQPAVAESLHQLYTRPAFLSPDSTPPKKPWIFIGTPGPGAHFHIDNVHQSSWQAQIRGFKKWLIKPPPECWWTCGSRSLEVIVNPGDIIVVNTNAWFHSTQVMPGPLSIVITNEYD